MNSPKLSREQLEKLVQNPHYRLSTKQQALLDEYRQADAKVTSQEVVELHTQEVRPTDTNVTATKVKKKGNDDADRGEMSTQDVRKEVQSQ